MSSSDSDDGFYSSVVKNMRIAREQCRQTRGNAPAPDVCSTVNTGKNDQGSSTVGNDVNTVKNTENVVNDTADVSFVDSIEDDLKLDEIIAKNSKPARGRGRGRKKKDTPVEAPKTCSGPEASNARGRGRSRRGRASKNNVTDAHRLLSDALDTSETLNSRGSKKRKNAANGLLNEALNTLMGKRRGRGRKKSRRSTSPNSSIEEVLQNQLSSIVNGSVLVQSSGPARRPNMDISQALASFNIPSYPIYSVGNTDEYPDKSDDIPLFSKSTSTNQPDNVSDDVVMVEEMDNLDDNEPLSVKVTWKSFEVFKFTIHKYQKLAPIFETFSQKENVTKDKLLFTYNNKILTCDDTPASIDYNIANFIDGGVVSHSVKNIINEKVKMNGIQIKFQCLKSKKPLEVWIGKDDKVMSAMRQCAELLDIPLDKLKFEFDGDIVTGTCTPQQMGLEHGDCIDVMILS